jgi:predicted DNA-binding protein (MmcQ/YjbR family)
MPAVKRHRNELALRDAALSYPETHEDFPWGHRAIKVRAKVFVFMSNDEPALSLSVKLPWSGEGALQFPFCEPTHYGMGKSGWVTATFGPKDRPDLAMLRSWIDESYRAVAPKRLVAAVAARAAAHEPPEKRAPASKKRVRSRVTGAASRRRAAR